MDKQCVHPELADDI